MRIADARKKKQFWIDGKRPEIAQVWEAVIIVTEQIQRDLEKLDFVEPKNAIQESKLIVVYTDANPNMVVFRAITESGVELASGGKKLEPPAPNAYIAELEAIKFMLINLPNDHMEVRCDNEAAVKQLNGEYHIKQEGGRNLILAIRKMSHTRDITFTWLKRGENIAGKLLK